MHWAMLRCLTVCSLLITAFPPAEANREGLNSVQLYGPSCSKNLPRYIIPTSSEVTIEFPTQAAPSFEQYTFVTSGMPCPGEGPIYALQPTHKEDGETLSITVDLASLGFLGDLYLCYEEKGSQLLLDTCISVVSAEGVSAYSWIGVAVGLPVGFIVFAIVIWKLVTRRLHPSTFKPPAMSHPDGPATLDCVVSISPGTTLSISDDDAVSAPLSTPPSKIPHDADAVSDCLLLSQTDSIALNLGVTSMALQETGPKCAVPRCCSPAPFPPTLSPMPSSAELPIGIQSPVVSPSRDASGDGLPEKQSSDASILSLPEKAMPRGSPLSPFMNASTLCGGDAEDPFIAEPNLPNIIAPQCLVGDVGLDDIQMLHPPTNPLQSHQSVACSKSEKNSPTSSSDPAADTMITSPLVEIPKIIIHSPRTVLAQKHFVMEDLVELFPPSEGFSSASVTVSNHNKAESNLEDEATSEVGNNPLCAMPVVIHQGRRVLLPQLSTLLTKVNVGEPGHTPKHVYEYEYPEDDDDDDNAER